MDLMDAIKTRKSVRAYEPKPVDRATVEELLGAAVMAPSGSNSQPWKFYVVTGQAKKELGRLLLSCVNENLSIPERRTGTRSALNMAEFNRELSKFFNEQEITFEQFYISLLQFYEAPVLIVLTLDDLVRENTLATGAAIENILLAATGRGLGACWMTFPFMQTKTGGQKIKRHLGIPPEDKIISCVVVGFPDRNSKLNQFKPLRKDPDSFIEWIGWE